MAITINGTNGIGVGTTPSHPLDIEVSSGDGVARIHAAENSNSSEARLRLEVSNDFAESIVETYDSSGIGGSLKYNHGDNAWRFSTTGDTERMRINSDGDVLIGRVSTCDSSEVLGIKGPDNDNCTFGITTDGTTQAGIIAFNDDNANFRGRVQYNHNGDSMGFYTSATETMRLARDGSHARVFMNCTESFSNAMFSLQTNGSCGIGTKAGADNTQPHLAFRNPNGEVGSISTNGSATSFNTSSDYRLKENVVAISDGITRLKTLKPSRFNFKADAKTTVDGFLAHEVTTVPEAIIGTKDEVDSDNNPVYQKIDQSKLVPLLTAALQEAIAKIETLETKVAALEAA